MNCDVKRVLVLLCFTGSLLGVMACEQEGPAERAGERVDESMEKAGEKMEEAGENIQDSAN
ncbi:MAG: hypothetical protein KC592_14405 [Nitrospira sp.]|nr:hypothetical protein [Nitrospira sp.]HBP89623.1 hypothetical protein [Nitrospiraceae bacterium]